MISDKKLLIFDLDGTIVDTIWSIRDGLNMTMREFGFPERSYAEVRQAIGNGARELVRRSMPSDSAQDAELVDRALAHYNDAYGQTYKNINGCYEGMAESMRALKARGYTLAVLSNKQDVYVKAIIELLFSDGTVSVAMGQTAELPRKPDPTVPLMIAEQLGFSAEQTVFVGDSEVDIMTGRNARMLTVGCAWGYRDRKDLESAGADVIIDHASELERIFDL